MRERGLGCAVVVAVPLLLSGCSPRPQKPPPTALVIATGPSGGVYQPLGDALARLYGARVPDVQVRAQVTPGSVFNVDAVQRGEADVAFAQGDAAYSAYRQGTAKDPRPHSNIRAIAVLYTNAMQIVARRDGPIRTVIGLKGRRVGMGPSGSNTELTARIVLEAHRLEISDLQTESLTFEQASERMVAGKLDADFVMASFPVAAIRTANEAVGIRLIPLDPEVIGSIRERYPFYRPNVIPRDTYAGQGGDVSTLGVDNLMICRGELGEDLVRRLTEVLMESLPELAEVHAAARGIDPEQAPAAPIPLHAGAARFYRERELSR